MSDFDTPIYFNGIPMHFVDDDDEYGVTTLGEESVKAEAIAAKLQVLENVSMYKSGMFEQLHLDSEYLGLPYGLWFEDLGVKRRDTSKKTRVKVGMPNGNLIPVSIDKYPKILHSGCLLSEAEKELNGEKRDEMFRFISKNYKRMLKHWYGDITNITMIRGFGK
ncbi:hypothetical protein FACS1894120_4060 [Clostridia bacterium]|nr:hypothetical protein FACS1894120_4060 [Clostridia bacterium]